MIFWGDAYFWEGEFFFNSNFDKLCERKFCWFFLGGKLIYFGGVGDDELIKKNGGGKKLWKITLL